MFYTKRRGCRGREQSDQRRQEENKAKKLPNPVFCTKRRGCRGREQSDQRRQEKRRNGAPGKIRTPDPLIRSQVLYPAELPAHILSNIDELSEYLYCND